MKRLSLCIFCEHFQKVPPATCTAYPGGIPRPFLLGKDMHVAPAEGDNGIQFQPANDLSEENRRTALQLVEWWEQQQEKHAAS